VTELVQTRGRSRRAYIRQRIKDYMDLTKPRILLLTIVTVLGSMAAAGDPLPKIAHLSATLIGVALAVGAGGALNAFIERTSDGKMFRTSRRPLPSGRMRPLEALIFGTALWIASYFILFFLVNPLSAYLTMLAFGSYVGLYTPLKRLTPLCTLVGAIPGALPPLIGWAAIRGTLDPMAWVLFGILFLWQIPHFLALAILRRNEYTAAGIPMLPSSAGEPAALRQMVLYTAALLPVSILPSFFLANPALYFMSAVGMGGGFLHLAIRGWTTGARPKWCRIFFGYSIGYLSVLFLTLALGF